MGEVGDCGWLWEASAIVMGRLSASGEYRPDKLPTGLAANTGLSSASPSTLCVLEGGSIAVRLAAGRNWTARSSLFLAAATAAGTGGASTPVCTCGTACLDSSILDFLCSRNSRIRFTVSSSSPKSAQLDSGITSAFFFFISTTVTDSTACAFNGLLMPSTAIVARFAFAIFFRFSAAGLALVARNEEVRVGIESAMALAGEIRLGDGEVCSVAMVEELACLLRGLPPASELLASDMSESRTSRSSSLALESLRYKRAFVSAVDGVRARICSAREIASKSVSPSGEGMSSIVGCRNVSRDVTRRRLFRRSSDLLRPTMPLLVLRGSPRIQFSALCLFLLLLLPCSLSGTRLFNELAREAIDLGRSLPGEPAMLLAGDPALNRDKPDAGRSPDRRRRSHIRHLILLGRASHGHQVRMLHLRHR